MSYDPVRGAMGQLNMATDRQQGNHSRGDLDMPMRRCKPEQIVNEVTEIGGTN